MGQLLDGHALARRIGFRIPCITHPCYSFVTYTLAELDPVLVAAMLAALVIVLLAKHFRCRHPCQMMPLACAHVVLTVMLLLLPSRAMLQRHIARPSGPQPRLQARECIALSRPGMKLTYPADAEAHFASVHAALRPWLRPRARACTSAGFCGTQVEDMWIAEFGARAGLNHRLGQSNATAPTGPLRATFGPFVPLFLPWNVLERAAWGSGGRYPRGLVEAVARALRPDVMYVTVSQSDQGLFGETKLAGQLSNVLVLSAGGFGHVPLPLLQKPLRALRPRREAGTREATRAAEAAGRTGGGFGPRGREANLTHQTSLLPPAERPFLSSYVGSLGHAPHAARQWMRRLAEASCWLLGRRCVSYRGPQWVPVMARSRFSLCPRGFGRNSFHLAETIQLGLVPVVIYTDVPWIPYATRFEASGGLVSSVFGLPQLLLRLSTESDAQLEAREARTRRLAASHFSLGGLAKQIAAFLLDRPTDLECTVHPPTVRDAEASASALALGLAAGLLAAAAFARCVRGWRRRAVQADRRERADLLQRRPDEDVDEGLS